MCRQLLPCVSSSLPVGKKHLYDVGDSRILAQLATLIHAAYIYIYMLVFFRWLLKEQRSSIGQMIRFDRCIKHGAKTLEGARRGYKTNGGKPSRLGCVPCAAQNTRSCTDIYVLPIAATQPTYYRNTAARTSNTRTDIVLLVVRLSQTLFLLLLETQGRSLHALTKAWARNATKNSYLIPIIPRTGVPRRPQPRGPWRVCFVPSCIRGDS